MIRSGLCAFAMCGLQAHRALAQANPATDPATWRTPEYLADWGLEAMRAADAYAAGYTGLGVTVGVIDSGVYAAHPEFADGRVKPVTLTGTFGSDGFYLMDAYGNPEAGAPSWSFFKKGQAFTVPGTYDPLYNDPHGTHVTGTIAAARDGVGMHGVAFAAEVTVANTKSIDFSRHGANIDYSYFKAAYEAVALSGARAINTSWGDPPVQDEYNSTAGLFRAYATFSGKKTLLDAMDEVTQKSGVLQVVIAGNTAYRNSDIRASLPYFRPALESRWLAVGAAEQTAAQNVDPKSLVIGSYSNKAGVDKYWYVVAPGSGVFSAVPPYTQGAPWNPAEWNVDPNNQTGYTAISGTSMAAPHATGALALIMQRFPYMTNEQTRDVLLTTAYHRDAVDGTPDANPNAPNAVWGWGVIDLAEAMKGPGQFLGPVAINLPAGTRDTWSHDISEDALIQRRQENIAEAAAWTTRKATRDPQMQLSALVAAIPSARDTLGTLVTALRSGSDQTLQDALQAIDGNPLADKILATFIGINQYGGSWPFVDPQDRTYAGDQLNSYLSALTDADCRLAAAGAVTDWQTEVQVKTARLAAFDTMPTQGSLMKRGGGTLTLSGTNTFSGGVTVAGGALSVARDASLGAAGSPLTFDGGILQVTGTAFTTTTRPITWTDGGGGLDIADAANTFTLAQALAGTGGLTKLGPGTLALAGTNTFAGPTTIAAGTLLARGGQAIGDLSAVTVASGATLALTDSETVGSLAGPGRVALGSARLTAGGDDTSTTFAGTLDGAGGLTKAGIGTLTLTGANTYTGGTTIAAGALQVGTGGTSGSLIGDVVDAGILAFNRADDLTYAGTVSGSGSLTKLGSGALTLTGIHTYLGATTINGGTLSLSGSASITSSSGVSLATGTTLDVSRVTTGRVTIAGLSDTAAGQAGTVALGTNALILANASGSFGGAITGAGGLTLGGGIQRMTGANSYTGGTTISGGTLSAANPAALGGSAATVVAGATLDVDGVSIGNTLTLTGAGVGGTGALTGTGTAGVSGPITLGGTAALSGSGTLTLSGAIGDGGNGYGLTKLGTGTAILTAANTYAGGTTVTAGTLALSGAGTLGRATATTAITGANAVLDLGGTRQRQAAVTLGEGATLRNGVLAAPVTSAGGTLERIAGSAALTTTAGTTISTANTYTGATTIGDGSVLKAGGAGGFSAASAHTLAGSGILDLAGTNNTIGTLAGAPATTVTSSAGGPAVLTVAGLAGTIFAGTIQDGAGPLGLTLVGSAPLTLTGANTYTGATTIGAGATLRLGDGGATGVITGSSGVYNDGTLVFDRADAVTFAAPITGSGSLTHAGSGTTVLTNRNTYTGRTTIAAGTLQVDGVLTASDVTVRGGGTLAGSGKIGDPLIEAGGRLAPGSATAIGTLSITGPLTFAAGSVYAVKVTPSANDRTNVTGPVTIQGGTVQVLAGSGTYTPALRYTLLTATGGVTGRFTSLQTTSNLAFLTPSLAYDGGSVALGFAQTAPIASAATTPNQGGVAQALNGAGPTVTTTPAGSPAPVATTSGSAAGTVTTTVSTGRGTTVVVASPAAQVMTAVLNQTAPGAARALNSLSGEAQGSVEAARAQTAFAVQGTLLEHLRFGTDPADGRGLTGAVGQRFAPGTTLPAGYAAFTPDEPTSGLVPVRPLAPRYGVWGQAFGVFGATDTSRSAARLTRETGGFMLGAETGPGVLGDALGSGLDGWRVGAAAGYSFTQFDVTARQSSGQIEGAFGGAYAVGVLGPVQIRLGAVYGSDALDTRRTVLFPGFAQAITGRAGGTVLQGFGEVGYRIGGAARYVEPFVGAAALRLHRDGFTETGGSAALAVFGQSERVETATAGVQAEVVVADLFGGAGPLLARGLIGYRHAFGDVTPTALLAFRGGGTAFHTAGAPMARDAAVASVGLDWQVAPGTRVGLAYDGQLGRRAQDHAVKASLAYRW